VNHVNRYRVPGTVSKKKIPYFFFLMHDRYLVMPGFYATLSIFFRFLKISPKTQETTKSNNVPTE
jgi:hypothetical protein